MRAWRRLGGGAPGGPVITINGFALMGGVEVKRKRSREDKLDKLAAKLDAKIEKLERKSRELE